ncbi:MAG TPA: FixH family protein [Ktedonobacteraceae bacterium]|nr:FixH family protein [Ktedonobacteraceae bacterium]
MRRSLLVVALGITFLILMTWLGTVLTSIIPHQVTAQEQTVRVGPYQLTLQVNPNPPLITQPAALSISVLSASTQQPVTNARVTLESAMVEMDMGADKVEARAQGDGTYLANVQFSMSGLWKVHVIVAVPGAAPVSTDFEVTAQ